MEPSAKDFVLHALEATGLSVDELAEKLDYKSLRRAMAGEIPLPESKRRHITDIVQLHQVLERMAHLSESGGASRVPPSPREKLKWAREEAHLTVKELAKKAGVQIGVLQALEDTGARLPEKVAEKVAAALDSRVTVEELMSGSESPLILDETGASATVGAKARGPLAAYGARTVPVLSEAACGQLRDVSFLDEAFTDDATETMVRDRQAFGVRLSGDSMAPEMSPGDTAIVAPLARPQLGKPVIVRTIHGDVLCKYYQTKEGGKVVVLSSVNKAYEPIEIPASEIAWMYPVKEVIKHY